MDESTDWHADIHTTPHFLSESEQLAKKLNSMSFKSFKATLGLSESLSKLNKQRFAHWNKQHDPENSKPSILLYFGDVFQKLHPKEYNRAQQEYAQKSLRVISGLYGLLRPYDLIQPYRLEMKTSLKVGRADDLYEFWGTKLTDWLNEQVLEQGHQLLADVSSKAYTKAIQFDQIDCNYVHVNFKQFSMGKLRNLMLNSKHARGQMIDYLIRTRAETIEDIKGFHENGYQLHYEDEHQLTFATEI